MIIDNKGLNKNVRVTNDQIIFTETNLEFTANHYTVTVISERLHVYAIFGADWVN